jgi:hypothetical protein
MTYFAASDVSASIQPDPRPRGDDDNPDPRPFGSVNYTQNNYSPKALTNAEIYRQTKNQLSTAKGALPV